MQRKFLDTSGLVKLYVPEPNSWQIQSEVRSEDVMRVVSRFSLLEYRSALYGLLRRGALTQLQVLQALALLTAGLAKYQVVPITESALVRAEVLLSRVWKVLPHARLLVQAQQDEWSAEGLLRTYLDKYGVPDKLMPGDAIILATAIEEHAREAIDAFLTTDQVQAKAAREEGLTVLP